MMSGLYINSNLCITLALYNARNFKTTLINIKVFGIVSKYCQVFKIFNY